MAVVAPRLVAATREQLAARERTLDVDVEAYVELAGDGKDAIGAYGVALELVDLSRQDGEPDSIVATNIYHRAVISGETAVALDIA